MTQTRADAVAALPALRQVIEDHGLNARKALGQNFLLDLNITNRIVRAAFLPDHCTVIEIGPGPGGLTRSLLMSPAQKIVAVERDDRCIAALQDLVTASAGDLTLIAEDALKIDFLAVTSAPRAIVANLPYNISTVLLVGWLRQIADFDSLTLMFQREVAERIVAKPSSKAYGRLSVLCQWVAKPVIAFHLPARAFTPPPKVSSSVVRLTARDHQPDAVRFATMEKITQAAFGQRRKMLRGSLKSVFADPESTLNALNINPQARAEELSIDQFDQLVTAFLAAEPIKTA